MSKFFKFTGSVAVVAVMMLAGSAMAGVDIDGSAWDLEWDDGNNPLLQGWNAGANTALQLNTRIGAATGATPGWLTATGNAGGAVGKNPVTTNTKAGGWTAEWRMFTHPGFNQGEVKSVVGINDDTNMFRVHYDPSTDTVTFRDGMPPSTEIVNVTVDLRDESSATNPLEHTYRIVREPGSDTVEFYVDSDFSSPAAQITPIPIALPFADAGNLNSIGSWAVSTLESSWDFFRYRSLNGTPLIVPEPASLTLLGLGGLMLLRRRR